MDTMSTRQESILVARKYSLLGEEQVRLKDVSALHMQGWKDIAIPEGELLGDSVTG